MGDFIVIRPNDDSVSQQSSKWCDDLIAKFIKHGHVKTNDIDNRSPANASTIDTALRGHNELVCYFGHGDEHSWLTSGKTTVDTASVSAASGKAVVSVACKTGQKLGPNAITAGVVCWLGFTIKVPVIKPHKTMDPLGEAIVDALAGLASSSTMQQVRDDLVAKLNHLVTEYDTGSLKNHPAATIAYFAIMALRDHVVAHGKSSHCPL